MTDIETPHNDDETAESTDNRRALLAKLALGGAGAAVGAVAIGRSASAGDEANAGNWLSGDNDAVQLGQENPSTTFTAIVNTPAAVITEGPSTFTVAKEIPTDELRLGFPARVGGYGDDLLANGVHASTTETNGFGLIAANGAPEPGEDEDVEAPRAAALAAQGAHIWFVAGSAVGAPNGNHLPGEMYVDGEGTLWFTVPEGEDGVRFVKLAGTPTTGALELLPVPVRVADTRIGNPTGKPESDSGITVNVLEDLAEEPSGVPEGARAVLLTATVANTEVRGFFAVYAADETPEDPQAFSTGNWVGDGLAAAQSATSRLSPEGEITVYVGGFGTADIVVDVVGFYL
ncbi:MAG: hypothetical protein AAFY28_05965 [Actinomycetota bacterium]